MHCDVVSLNMLILEICNCPQLDGVLFFPPERRRGRGFWVMRHRIVCGQAVCLIYVFC